VADTASVVIEARGVEKHYHGLRPLRVHHLEVREGDTVALVGFDQAAAETFVNLITAATLPDAGEVSAFGLRTTAIEDADTWLRSLDRFGIVSERAIVLDNMTVLDNLTMPLTMSLHDVPDRVRSVVLALADEVGLGGALLGQAVASLGPLDRLRLRLGRALGPGPRVLLAEHPNALLPSDVDRGAFAADYARLVAARRLTSIVLTADPSFASAVATRVLTLQPATGELKGGSGWRRWFG
jgi:predicted ABC-type transport system involved in lysophospholipase L1 biosynthesis ATPase subunit